MLPVLTIIGRPNVGKSTLFNYLTHSRAAIVADMPGVTRDRQYGEGSVEGRDFIVVDTGGLAELNDPEVAAQTDTQVEQAIAEANYLLFLVDGKVGLSHADRAIAEKLREKSNVKLLVNKVDHQHAEIAASEFYELGLGEPYAISAKSGRGIKKFFAELWQSSEKIDNTKIEVDDESIKRIQVAVVGRPNVGKSTLINRILGEERVVVLDHPGTTRDSIYIPFDRQQQQYTLIDTAGVRRRSRVHEALEKFSYIKTLQAIHRAHVVVLLLNAQEGISDQDLRLINLVMTEGKAIVLAFNKWDGMSVETREHFKLQIDLRLEFVHFARRYFISALHGTGVGKLYSAIDECYQGLQRDISTSELTETLMQAVRQHQPPLVKGRRIRLRYAHVGGRNPLRIIIHGKQTQTLPQSYQRYLTQFFRKRFRLVGLPILLNFKSDANPYAE